jgi:hypothetical protein
MADTTNKQIWDTLSKVDVSKHVEKKGRFKYISWAWAWGILMEHYPEATFTNYSNDDGYPCFFDKEGYGMVRVRVTIEGGKKCIFRHTECLPVLDNTNAPIKNPNSFEVNTALKRCLVKAMAYYGLGHYIYAGEDLPPASEVEVAKSALSEMAKRKAVEAYMEHTDNKGKEASLLAWAGVESLDELTIEQINKTHKQMEKTA